MSNKPNFFIVGAAKSGTSSLWQYLRNHPQIYMPEDELHKEPRYFNNPKRFKSDDQYFDLFKNATRQHLRIGEASTAYLTCENCAKKILDYKGKYNLDVKIIILLRNPINRAYSLYNWMVQDGYEYSSSFESALQREEKRKIKTSDFWDPNYFHNYMYFSSGLYVSQIERYWQFLGKENVYVGIFEEFTRNTNEILKEMMLFLGVDENLEFDISEKFNPSYHVIHPFFQFMLRKSTKYLSRLRIIKFNTKEKRDRLLKWGLTNHKIPKIDPSLKVDLLNKYLPEIQQLEKILKKDLSIWKKTD